jgi:hypothetical protein
MQVLAGEILSERQSCVRTKLFNSNQLMRFLDASKQRPGHVEEHSQQLMKKKNLKSFFVRLGNEQISCEETLYVTCFSFFALLD